MLQPELKEIVSHDLDYGKLPCDPDNCAVFIEAGIGVKGQGGSDIFSFTVITPTALSEENTVGWGRGYLIVPSFTWASVENAITKLLGHCRGESWDEISAQLNKELHWEFENYKESPI